MYDNKYREMVEAGIAEELEEEITHEEGVYRDSTIDEKVTVISSVVHTYIGIVHTKPRWRLRWDQCYFFCY